MSEKSRVEKTIVEAEKAVAEARKVVAEAKDKLARPLRKEVYLAEGKINKYANLHLPKRFFEQTRLPQKVDIPVTMHLQEDRLILNLPKPEAFSKKTQRDS
ncbi:MAG: hypothetical protein ACE5L6_01920 [Candidatus Bathyarchaeia archaeon]